MEEKLGRADWLNAARLALLLGGVEAVRVEKLARSLGVTKGSFYWHFADRGELLEALLKEWEDEADLLVGAAGVPGGGGLAQLLRQIETRLLASERGEVPSDAAIFAWAGTDPAISARVAAAEEERVAFVATLMGSREQAELFYMAYLGFVLRRRHAPDASRLFTLLSRFASRFGRAAPATTDAL
jgi:AcrR family transcriptional regulator